MKKSILCALGMSLLTILPNFALAGQSNVSKIDRVEVTETMFAIYPATGGWGKESCENDNVMVFYVADFPNSHSKLLSVALAAKAANNDVRMFLNGCQATPWGYTVAKPSSLVYL